MNILKTLPLFLFMLIWACAPDSSIDPELVAKAEKIQNSVITLDTHVDINTGNFTEEKNYTMNLDTQVDLPKMEDGGLDVVFLIVYTGQGELDQEGFDAAYENAISKFDAIHRLTEELAPDQIELALTSDDVRRIHAAGKKVAMIGVENAYPLGMELDRVKEFYDRGARYMSLSHNGHSQLSDSNTGERDDVWLHNGLSDFGKEVIAEMNKWGIMIDLSHPSKKANMQTMELSKAPVIASHSSARALDPSVSRNLDDEELMMLKENGGVVQTVAFRSYVNSEKHEAYREAAAKIEEEIAEEMGFEMVSRDSIRQMSTETRSEYFALYQEMQKKAQPRIEKETETTAPSVNVEDFVDHIDYMVDLIGIEHVGISSDFDGGGGVNGWMDASETLNVTIELVKRGYTQEQIEMIWSGNLLRVLDEVQKVAAEIQAEG
ncbi:MAG TPA: peptidase M19 [Balneola sp.]|jgi:membrane dipeptidase|nr:peptidase M19 [Balneola sp.]MAO77440.1 peptidase M19 [Balneola sp.]MBF65398.1 peptidase M19 [Balneola sp.]HAH50280.1 peptidase M19 [Balneola sp.]HBZ38229.1 peptidase M19 [Balneola sp.]|tara:strand:+ start:5630 stop:6931 length:1302 start_codon:yes stop_codon:yes gene_type:complete